MGEVRSTQGDKFMERHSIHLTRRARPNAKFFPVEPTTLCSLFSDASESGELAWSPYFTHELISKSQQRSHNTRLFRAAPVPVITISLAGWCPSSCTMHPAHIPAPNCRSLTGKASVLTVRCATGSRVLRVDVRFWCHAHTTFDFNSDHSYHPHP